MIAERFKTAVETGRVDDLISLYAPGAHLDARLAGREVTADGPDAIVAVLAAWWPGPGRLDLWDCAVSDGGVRVMLERAWDADDSTERTGQIHHVHVEQGRISRHDVFSTHARFGPPPTIGDPVPSFLRDARSREPLPHDGDSGSYLERVVLADGTGSIVKHVSPSFDWIMRATHDTGREAELWLGGYLQDLPGIDVPTTGVEREGDGWAIAQRDVSDALIADRAPVSRDETRQLLEAADIVHRGFEGREVPGLCSMADRVFMFSPGVARAERDHSYLMPKVFGRGWELFPDVLGDDEVARTVLRLVENPAPLIDELTSDGTTLLHGDFYDSNLGLDGDRVIAIDWTMACRGPAEVDFAYYLHNFAYTPAQRRDELIADWRAIRGDDFDERRLRLALLFEVVIKGWCWSQSVWATNSATRDRLLTDMAWWRDQARAALEAWSPSRA